VNHVDYVIVSKRTGFAAHARALTVVAAVAVVSLFTLSSAGSSIPLAEKSFHHPTPPPAVDSAAIPTTEAPVVPMVFPPPPAAAAQPVTEEPAPEWVPAPAAVAPNVVGPAVVPEAVNAAPPVEHLPEVQPVQHIPDDQPSPPPDPLADVLNPLFGSLP
jgi:hypothetical protein